MARGGRGPLAAVALVTLAAAGCGAASGPGQEEDERPNVVVLMTDDQTLESMRVMPGVRRLLADRGTTFTRSFVSFALCCPSRATFLTGQYAHNHGVLGNRPPTGGYGRLDRRETLPVWLRRAGYRTMHVGKFLNRYGQDLGPYHVPPGWDDWHGSVDPFTYEYYGTMLNENGVLHTYPSDYSTDLYAGKAEELIGRAAGGDRPFFLSVGFLAPHGGGPRELDDPVGLATPVPASRHRDLFVAEPLPPSVRARFNESDMSDKPAFLRALPPIREEQAEAIEENYRQRLESLLAVDEAVVSIMNALRAAGELDNTLVIFTSDNGFFHGEHRMPSEKMLVYEPSIRVPLIMRGPGVPVGAERRQLVTNADLAPTILDVADASATKPQDGSSLLPLLADPRLEWGRDLLIEGPEGFNVTPFVALRTYRYVYVEYVTGERELDDLERELYDLERDPNELQSVHDDPAYAPVRSALAQRLQALRVYAGQSCRTRPAVSLRVSGCRVSARGRQIERVTFRARTRTSVSSGRFTALVDGERVRATVRTLDGRLVTLDRRLPSCG
jgi:N-acetylglucosamine-6-sulfatase